MIKVISPFRMNLSKMSRKECYDHWLNVHGPLVRKELPGIRKYVQDHPILKPGETPEWDAVAELYFDNVEAWEKALYFMAEDPRGQVIRDDSAKFVAQGAYPILVTEERIIFDNNG